MVMASVVNTAEVGGGYLSRKVHHFAAGEPGQRDSTGGVAQGSLPSPRELRAAGFVMAPDRKLYPYASFR
eukprot:1192140-Prorocentrum_minimum.AAC.1